MHRINYVKGYSESARSRLHRLVNEAKRRSNFPTEFRNRRGHRNRTNNAASVKWCIVGNSRTSYHQQINARNSHHQQINTSNSHHQQINARNSHHQYINARRFPMNSRHQYIDTRNSRHQQIDPRNSPRNPRHQQIDQHQHRLSIMERAFNDSEVLAEQRRRLALFEEQKICQENAERARVIKARRLREQQEQEEYVVRRTHWSLGTSRSHLRLCREGIPAHYQSWEFVRRSWLPRARRVQFRLWSGRTSGRAKERELRGHVLGAVSAVPVQICAHKQRWWEVLVNVLSLTAVRPKMIGWSFKMTNNCCRRTYVHSILQLRAPQDTS